MINEFENLLEDLDSGEEVKTKYGVCYAYSPDIVEKLKRALTELKTIKETESSEASECSEDRLTQKDVHWFNDKKFNYCINSKVDFEEDIDKSQDEKDYLIAVQAKELHFVVEKLGAYEDMGSPTAIKQVLAELKAIKEANPSDAMKCVERLHQTIGMAENFYDAPYEDNDMFAAVQRDVDTINQVLLKAQEQEHKLDKVEKLTQLLFKDRRKMGQEYIKWCEKNNAAFNDATNMVTWVLCIKLKEVLNNE